MMISDIVYKGFGSVMESYRKRILDEAEHEIRRIQEIDRVIRERTDGRITPVFV